MAGNVQSNSQFGFDGFCVPTHIQVFWVCGRFTTSDGRTLSYEHVENPTGDVTDRWAITRSNAHMLTLV